LDLVWQGMTRALDMLLRGDPEVLRVTWLTLKVSGLATLISLVAGIPLGTFLALARFPGRRLAV